MSNQQERKINQKKGGSQMTQEVDDWDLEDEMSKNADGYIPTSKPKVATVH